MPFFIKRNLFPDNMVQMTFLQYRTKLIPKIEIFSKINETSGKIVFYTKIII